MRVGLLARVSKEKASPEDQLSLPAQLRAMRSRCEREGWEVVEEFTVEGESAFTDSLAQRPTLQRAVEAAEAGSFEVLMVHESSRFARNALLALEVRRRLERAGVALLWADGRMEQRTAETGLFFTMTAGMNEYWSEKMGEHIRKVKRELFELGLHLGDVPFGYRRLGAREPYEVVRDEASAVSEGFRDYVSGASYTEILRRWNDQGLRPRSKQGNTQFTVPAMQTIFENDFYAGFVHHKGLRKVGAHEAIISEDLWLLAQSRVSHRAVRSPSPRMLSGVAMCLACEGPLWVSSRGKKGYTVRYYREPSLERGRSCANAQTAWRVEQAEAEMSRVIAGATADRAWLAKVAREARKQPIVRSDERERLQAEKRRATNAYLAEALEETEWRARVGAIDDRLSRLPVDVPGGVIFAGEKLANVGQLWEVMTAEERREALRLVFEQVLVDTREKRLLVRPWAEFEPLFSARRAEVARRGGRQVGPPGGGVNYRPTPWLYSGDDLNEMAS